MKVKIIETKHYKDLENRINDFLNESCYEEIHDIKYSTTGVDGFLVYTAMIIYEEEN